MQERSLRIIHNDYESSFETLLKCSKQESLLTKRLKIMILEVFKTANRLNPNCLHDLFTKNEVVYYLRTQKLEQPKRRTTTYGLRTFSYLGSKLWNLLASEYSEVNDIDYERLKFLIKYWAGPNHDSTFCALHACFRNHFFINLIAHTLREGDCQFDSFVVAGGTVSCHYDKLRCHQWWWGCRVDDLLFSEYDIALYILALFICRIIAFWLMLFVVNTTLINFILSYLILDRYAHKYRNISVLYQAKYRFGERNKVSKNMWVIQVWPDPLLFGKVGHWYTCR